MIRVIAGDYGGRVLKTAPGSATRPLRSQVREALFNVLGDWVVDKEVWDLFAGTGANGIEALSRGARAATFVEKSNQALSVLRHNLAELGAGDRGRVIKGDAWDPLAKMGEAEPPDLIFLDPPYKMVAQDPVLAACRAARLAEHLAPDGVLCFHFEEGLLDEDDFDQHLEVDLRRWGRTAIALLAARPLAAPAG